MYDTLTKKEVFVQCPILCVVCDNPRASEIAHHLGSSAIHFCRTCDVGFLDLGPVHRYWVSFVSTNILLRIQKFTCPRGFVAFSSVHTHL